MPLPTVNVSASIFDQNGNPVPGAIMRVEMQQTDVYNNQFVGPIFGQTYTADVNGLVTMPLWPNALGTQNSYYHFVATHPTTGKKLIDTFASVPNADCNLAIISPNFTPLPPPAATAQPLSANLTSIAGLVGAADNVIYFTGPASYAIAPFTALGRSIMGAVTAAAAATAIALGVASTPTFAGLSLTNAAGARITGDFSNATIANRAALQTSTTNGATIVSAIPNGTSSVVGFIAYGDSAATNGSFAGFRVDVIAGDARFSSGAIGTGTILPMTFYVGANNGMTIATSGLVTANLGMVVNGGSLKILGANGGAFTGGEWSRDNNWGTYYKAPAAGTTADLAFFDSTNVNGILLRTANIDLGGVNGSPSLRVLPVANAVNRLEALGSISSVFPTAKLRATGTGNTGDGNVNLLLSAAGTGAIQFYTADQDLQLLVAATAGSTRWVQITGSVAGSPTISTSAGSLAITPATVFAGAITASNGISATNGSFPGVASNAIWLGGADNRIHIADSARTANNRVAGFQWTGGTFHQGFWSDNLAVLVEFLTVSGGQAAGITSIALGGPTAVTGQLSSTVAVASFGVPLIALNTAGSAQLQVQSSSGYGSIALMGSAGNPGYAFFMSGGVEQARIAGTSSQMQLMAGNTATLAMTLSTTGISVALAANFPGVGTTASAANAFLDNAASNNLLRSTSSLKYKADLLDLTLADSRAIALGRRAFSYRSLSDADDSAKRWIGYAAEEIAPIDERFVTFDQNGAPNWVQYERFVVPHGVILDDHEARIAALEAKTATLQ